MPDWTTLASTDELQPGDRKADFIDDEPVLLVRIDDNYFCIADACSHDGQPLGDGPITGEDITCSRHGARFSLATGDALCMPATEPVATYAIRIADGQVQARLGGTDDVATTSNDPPPAKTDDDADTTDTADTATPAPVADSPEPDVDSSTTGDDGIQASAMLEALREVIDPELMVNIVDLGLIYDVRQDGDDVVSVDMTLTSPACPAGPQLVQQSKMALERLEGIAEANINLVMTPPWTPERMTDDARDKLGIF